MSYPINKTNGQLLVNVADESINTSASSITLVGKSLTNYGEFVNENFIRMLENFANTSEPANKLAGQVWYDTSATVRKLKFYDGNEWRTLQSVIESGTQPVTGTEGDLWWDSTNDQMYAYDADSSKWILVGPGSAPKGVGGLTGMHFVRITDTSSGVHNALMFIINADGQNRPFSILSFDAATYTMQSVSFPNSNTTVDISNFTTYNGIKIIAPGYNANINHLSAGAVNFIGISSKSKDSDRLAGLQASAFAQKAANETITGTWTFNNAVTAPDFIGTATRSKYADLAERFSIDPKTKFSTGMVVRISKDNEYDIELCSEDSPAVLGVIPDNPGLMMNSEAGDDSTHPYVTWCGRVHVYVKGTIDKGDRLVISDIPGIAKAFKYAGYPAIQETIGIALETSTDENIKKILVAIGAK